MSKKPETGTILFEVALLTIVVFLVDEWLIRGALAFIPAMLLAQRALDTAKVAEGWAPADQGSAVPITQGMAMASPAAAGAPSEESSSEVTPEPAAGLPTL